MLLLLKAGFLNLFLAFVQLYVSVDAATKDALKAIDRPLFGDFWERFIVSTFKHFLWSTIYILSANRCCVKNHKGFKLDILSVVL